jgi:hypothetical protein
VKSIPSSDGSFDLAIGETIINATRLTDSSWELTVLGTGIMAKNPPQKTPENPRTDPPPFVPAQPDRK